MPTRSRSRCDGPPSSRDALPTRSLQLNAARDFADFRLAAASFEVPSQNMLYADVDGHIGYQMPGKIPVRVGGDGTSPVPGWNTSYGWSRYIPFGQLPWTLDPPEQYIVAANQAVVGPDYPYLLTRDWSYGYRSQRLVDLIERSDRPHSRIRGGADDRHHQRLRARRSSRTCSTPSVDADTAEAQALLVDWQFDQPVDSAPAAYYNAVWRHLLARVFDDELTGDLRPDGSDRWFEVMRELLTDPWSRWWDDATTEDIEFADEVIAGRDAGRRRRAQPNGWGTTPTQWRWGDLHQLELTHQTFGTSGVGPARGAVQPRPVRHRGR